MPTRFIARVLAVAAGLFATATALGPGSSLAAGDCFAQPNRQPAAGGHWYYRSDRINNRKCWYLVAPATTTPQPEAPEPPPTAETLQPTFPSFFSSLAAGFAETNPVRTQQGSSDAAQTARPDGLTNDDAVRVKRPRQALRRSNAALIVPHRQAPARPRVELADERPVPPSSQAERDTLFQEFLRWKERQRP